MPKDRTLYETVARNLNALLEERQMTPAQLARKSGVVKGKLHYVVHGHFCGLDVAVKICKVLKISLDSLVSKRKASNGDSHTEQT